VSGALRRGRRATVPAAAAACLLALAGSAVAASSSGSASATARRVLLGRSELGRGWSVEAPAPAHALRLTCRAFSPRLSGVRVRASVASPTLQQSSQGPFLSQAAYLYGAAGQERVVWRHVVISRLLRCAAATFAAGGTSYAVTSSRVSALHRPGGTVTRYRIAGTVAGGGQTLPAYLDELVLGRGVLITVLDVSSFDAPASDRLESQLAGLALAKLRATA
jgi:hypothetical protein